MRRTSSRLAEGELTHIDRVAVDIELARRQWDDYVAALEANGFPVVEVDASDDHADSVFIEDAVVVFGDLAVLTSPGAESRRGETDAVRPVIERLGLEVATIELPGTLDGGDVLKIGTGSTSASAAAPTRRASSSCAASSRLAGTTSSRCR